MVIRDDATGKENMDIDWHVAPGDGHQGSHLQRSWSFHPMQHPMHLHGQRMLVVSRNGSANPDWCGRTR